MTEAVPDLNVDNASGLPLHTSHSKRARERGNMVAKMCSRHATADYSQPVQSIIKPEIANNIHHQEPLLLT